jgi:dipeptidyl aminopeptidase B
MDSKTFKSVARPTVDDEGRTSRDSMSSVSTTSLIFDRLSERVEDEKFRQTNRRRNPSASRHYTDAEDFDDDDPLKETDSNDLETGPFLRTSLGQRQGMDRSLRRCLVILGIVIVGGWVAALFVFVSSEAYKHQSQIDHDPDATERGSGKAVTLDQVMSGFWRSASHDISWIAGPEGEDGLLLEQGAVGKDYLVVEDVRAGKKATIIGDITTITKPRTLMKNGWIEYGGEQMIPHGVWPSPDMKKVLVATDRKNNWRHSFTATYWIFDVETQMTEPLDPENISRVQLASWSPQSDAIAFTRDNNLFIRKLSGNKKIVQITQDGGPEYFYGVPDWVYEEEVFAGNSATWWSEDGKYITFLRTNESGVPEYPVQYFVSRPSGTPPIKGEEAYPEVRQIKYPKAGAHNPVVDLLFYDVNRGDVFSVEIDGGFADDDRLITTVLWAGQKVLIKETNRVSDVMRVILVDVAARTGKTVNTINVEQIDGGWFEISQKTQYIPADPAKGRSHDGYIDTIIYDNNDHLAYFTPMDSPDPLMLTSGRDWEVVDAPSAIDLESNLVYFVGTKESSIQRHVYSVKLDGTDIKPVTNTSAEGYYDISFSKGAGFGLMTYSGPNVPWQKVVSTPSNPTAYEHVVEKNEDLAEKARKHNLPLLKYGTISIDGVELNYLERRPPHFDGKKQYPVLFQQYSGPGSQSVSKRFTVDFQSYVASGLGYVVVTVDGRGTGFIGRKNRVLVRQNLGHWESHDQIEAAKIWAAKKYVDSSKIAIWGWSYGGFNTLKTLEQDGGRTFKYGMAVAPVTDWRFYDSIYTERYMKTPQLNPGGYEQSAINNVTALAGNVRFLIMHGIADDNVHMQNSLTLLDKLDLATIENYDVHVFPDSDHGIYFHNANRIVYDSEFAPLLGPGFFFLTDLQNLQIGW